MIPHLFHIRVCIARGIAVFAAGIFTTLLEAAPVSPTIDYSSQPAQLRPHQSVPGASVAFTLDSSAPLPNGTLQWLHNDAAIAGETRPDLVLTAVTASDSGNYRLRVTTDDGVVYSNTATLNVAPLPTSPVDPSFAFTPDPARPVVGASVVWTFADGSLLAELSNQEGETSIVRLRDDGSLDGTYVFPTNIGDVLAGAADGTLITSRWPYRLAPNGTPLALTLPASFDGGRDLVCATLDGDGRIYVAQDHNLARFHSDGSLDTVFAYAPSIATAVWDLSLDANGHVNVFGGQATEVPTHSKPVVFRLQSSGAIDPAFAPTFENIPYSPFTPLMTWDPLSDGRYLFMADGKHQHLVQLYDGSGQAVPGWLDEFPGYTYTQKHLLVDRQRARIYLATSVSGGVPHAYKIGEHGLDAIRDFDVGNHPFYLGKTWTIPAYPSLAVNGDLLMAGPFEAWDGHASPFLARLDFGQLDATDAVPATRLVTSNPEPKRGETVELWADSAGSGPLSYHWIALDGQPLPTEANMARLRIDNITFAQLGRYQVRVTGPAGSALGPVVELQAPPGLAPRMANLSGRAVPGLGEDAMIAGLTVGGTDSPDQVPLLLRGVGPSLEDFGLTDFLPNPVLDVYAIDQSIVANNDNWADGDPATVQDYALTSGAFPLIEDSLDAALPFASPDAQYTLRLFDATDSAGAGLLEIYHVSPSRDSTARLLNLSLRARTGTDDATVTAGFVIDDPAQFDRSARLLLRAIGPGLADKGITQPLTDPILKLHNAAGEVIRVVDDWGDDEDPAALASTMAQVGAFELAEGSADAAVLLDLPAGVYTLSASGKNDTGIVLIEIYLVP